MPIPISTTQTSPGRFSIVSIPRCDSDRVVEDIRLGDDPALSTRHDAGIPSPVATRHRGEPSAKGQPARARPAAHPALCAKNAIKVTTSS
jgi:hypothetical protein